MDLRNCMRKHFARDKIRLKDRSRFELTVYFVNICDTDISEEILDYLFFERTEKFC